MGSLIAWRSQRRDSQPYGVPSGWNSQDFVQHAGKTRLRLPDPAGRAASAALGCPCGLQLQARVASFVFFYLGRLSYH